MASRLKTLGQGPRRLHQLLHSSSRQQRLILPQGQRFNTQTRWVIKTIAKALVAQALACHFSSQGDRLLRPSRCHHAPLPMVAIRQNLPPRQRKAQPLASLNLNLQAILLLLQRQRTRQGRPLQPLDQNRNPHRL